MGNDKVGALGLFRPLPGEEPRHLIVLLYCFSIHHFWQQEPDCNLRQSLVNRK